MQYTIRTISQPVGDCYPKRTFDSRLFHGKASGSLVTTTPLTPRITKAMHSCQQPNGTVRRNIWIFIMRKYSVTLSNSGAFPFNYWMQFECLRLQKENNCYLHLKTLCSSSNSHKSIFYIHSKWSWVHCHSDHQHERVQLQIQTVHRHPYQSPVSHTLFALLDLIGFSWWFPLSICQSKKIPSFDRRICHMWRCHTPRNRHPLRWPKAATVKWKSNMNYACLARHIFGRGGRTPANMTEYLVRCVQCVHIYSDRMDLP